MKTAITLCRVAEAAAGPFVFHQELEQGFAKAAEHGFDSVELFFPDSDAHSVEEIQELQAKHGLGVAAVGTGAGMVKHSLSLTNPDPAQREAALQFILCMVELGGHLKAPAILGSMQGRWGGEVNRDQALGWLAQALRVIGEAAAKHDVPFIYEPLNRYETNLINQVGEAADWVRANELNNIVLLADMFHMNIEEVNVADAMRAGGDLIGHVHYADSNRRAMGFGHTNPAPVVTALKEIGYSAYLSAEVFPWPDADQAAAQTLKSIQSLLP
jgi:sugar phosphate isomerase/epimerase